MGVAVYFSRLNDEAREARSHSMNRRLGVIVAAVFFIAGVLDVISTEVTLATGFAEEANPIVRAIMDWIGSFWVVPKIIAHVLIAMMILWFPSRATLATMAVVSGVVLLAVVNNTMIYASLIGLT